MKLSSSLLSVGLGVLLLSGCATGNSNGVTGSAAGSNNNNANTKIEKCSRTLGTLAFYEDQNSDWYSYLTRNYKLTSTIPVLRLLAQQTGCFVIVERGAMMDNMMQERALDRSGELRSGSGFGKGKMVAADYTIRPEIFFSNEDTGGVGGVVGALFGSVAGAVAGGFSTPEGKTLVNAFLDSMNQLVIALKDYKAQTVKGGLGKGGSLKVGD